ncbi:MAG TPA: sigma 54-interacting transcriptional regulator [Patescibacteria group bacterium]|nr:sigma 54-interacting transcriptional regulator [Patescibacteria group bacterium]
MRKCIEASHARCMKKGFRPENIFSTKVLQGKELAEKLEKNETLISTAAPFLQQLYDFVKGSEFFVILNDSEGCILKVFGDDKILSEAQKLKMIPGAYMDEDNIGTNAMSMVLSEGRPVQVSAKEHFITAYHKWTCSAAPIKDADGRIIGIIDLTGFSQNVHLHTLGIVVAAANAVEKMLEVNDVNSKLVISMKQAETVFNSISSGILTSDLTGNINAINQHLTKMLGYSEFEIRNMKIWNLIEGWNEVLEILESGKEYIDKDININSKYGKLQFTLTGYPIYDSNNRLVEIIHMLHELKKSRKLAGKILSGQAIYTFDRIISKNEKFLKIIDYAKKIADSKSTVLLNGESGTGKEIFAQSIHNASVRKDEAFIAVNCGAIPRTLIESELFGYEEGAFTGAKKGGNAGKFELADDGTIFLDEIGEMPIDMQTKLLRVIEEGVVTRIGGHKQIHVDVRIIAATNKNLIKEIEKGNFRKDLFYRLKVLPINLPALRERKDDIPLLLDYYMKKTSDKLNKSIVEITPEYMEYLKNYDWPGNIRELENVIELIVNTGTSQISFDSDESEVIFGEMTENVILSLEQVEKQHIVSILQEVKGSISIAAKVLGIGRSTLYRKMEKYNIGLPKVEQFYVINS